MNWSALAQRIEERRGCGQVISAGRVWQVPPSSDELKRWLEQQGFTYHLYEPKVEFELPGVVVEEKMARGILDWLVHFDLAYEDKTKYSRGSGEVDEYFSTLLEGCEFRTNGDYVINAMTNSGDKNGKTLGGWMPMTPATFDAGIITFHPQQTTFLWFLDED